MRPLLILVLFVGAGATLLSADPAETPAAAEESAVRMDPYVVVAPRSKPGFWNGLSQTLNQAVGKKFMNLRGGPLLDAIMYRVKFMREHPGEQAIVVVSSEPAHGRVTAATVVFTENGLLYASSASLGDHHRLSGFTVADMGRPDKIRGELQSIRDVYLGVYDDWNRAHGGDALSQPFVSDGSDNSFNLDSSSFQQMRSRSLLPQGAALAQAEETGDYSLLAKSQQSALMAEYASDSEEQLKVAYDVLHAETYLPVARATLSLPVVSPGESAKPAPRQEEVLVFDWDGDHYLYNPDLGTYGVRIPRTLVTGLPALVLVRGDVLESLYFLATFRAMFPSEKAVLLQAQDGLHTAVAYTREGHLRIFSPALGTFEPPPKYRTGGAAQLTALHRVLVARQLKKGRRAPTAMIDRLPGDDSDLQTRRACLALRQAGFSCELSQTYGRPTLKVSWPGGSYTYVAPAD